jgi:hypothetical protein
MDEHPRRYVSPHHPRRDAYVRVWPRRCAGLAVVVEGPMCALAAAGLGAQGYALMGNTPPGIVYAAIASSLRAPGMRVLVIADTDALGAGVRILAHLAARGVYAEIRSPSPYKDFAEAPDDVRERLLA